MMGMLEWVSTDGIKLIALSDMGLRRESQVSERKEERNRKETEKRKKQNERNKVTNNDIDTNINTIIAPTSTKTKRKHGESSMGKCHG